MAVSQNGYSANDRSVIQSYAIGNSTHVSLRKGSTGAMLQHFANWFDINIHDIDAGQLDDWGYAERPIRGGVELSNHASGTAVDLNATKWPLGSQPSKYLTPAQITKVRNQLKVYQGCVRWGGDYTGRLDPMHAEINLPQATVDRVWAALTHAPAPTAVKPAPAGHPVLKLGSTGAWVSKVQTFFNKTYPAYSKLTVDGNFGAKTEWVVKEFQRRLKLVPDGIIGGATWAHISV